MKNKFFQIVDTIEEIFLVSVVSIISIIIFCQIVLRYVFHFVPSWMDELSVWLFVWSIWLGCAYCTKIKSHICIEAFTTLLPSNSKKVLNFFIYLTSFIFLSLLFYYGVKQAFSPSIVRQTSVVIVNPVTGDNVSMLALYISMPIGALFSILRMIGSLFNKNDKTLEANKGE